jgi:hypothetical protein
MLNVPRGLRAQREIEYIRISARRRCRHKRLDAMNMVNGLALLIRWRPDTSRSFQKLLTSGLMNFPSA